MTTTTPLLSSQSASPSPRALTLPTTPTLANALIFSTASLTLPSTIRLLTTARPPSSPARLPALTTPAPLLGRPLQTSGAKRLTASTTPVSYSTILPSSSTCASHPSATITRMAFPTRASSSPATATAPASQWRLTWACLSLVRWRIAVLHPSGAMACRRLRGWI